jgi:esterase/lipase
VRSSTRVMAVGVALLLGGLFTDLIGQKYQLLAVLILSLSLSIAGALVALRGMLEFLGERLSNRANTRHGE